MYVGEKETLSDTDNQEVEHTYHPHRGKELLKLTISSKEKRQY